MPKPFSHVPLRNYVYISKRKLDVLLPQLPGSLLKDIARAGEAKIGPSWFSAVIRGPGKADPHRVVEVEALRQYIIEHESVGDMFAEHAAYILDTVDALILGPTSRDPSGKPAVADGHVVFAGRCRRESHDIRFVFRGSPTHLLHGARDESQGASYWGSQPRPQEVIEVLGELEKEDRKYVLDSAAFSGFERTTRLEILAIRQGMVTYKPWGAAHSQAVYGSPIYVALA